MKYKRKSLTIITLLISLIVFIISNPIYAQETKQNNNQLISMSFREAELDYVLDFFSRATGYTIIKDADIKVRITIISQKDVPIDEALSVLNSILTIKGYAMIINGKVIKVVPLESAKQENMEIKVGSDPAEIGQTDTIVTQIMPLSYTSVGQVVKELKDLVPKYGVMVAHTQSNTLIITATSANINRFAQIIKALDIPMSDLIKIEVFFLKYRDADTLATVITKMFEKPTGTTTDQQNINNARRARGGFPGGPNFGPDQQGDQTQSSTTEESERLQIMGDVKVSADKTTNSLVVSASPSNLSLIKEVVAKLDTQTSAQAETRIFTLEHADATTMAEEINDAFSSTSSTSRTSSTQSIFNRQGFGGGGFPGGPGQNQGNQASSTGSGVLGLPEVRAVGEQRTNSLIVTTTSVQMAGIATLIKQLDQDVSEYEQSTMIISLENAEAANMATVLNSLFQTTAFEQQRGRSSFSSTSGGVMGTSATTVATARGLTGNVKIVAESTTNSLAITTYKRNFPILEEIIKELDVMLPQVLIEVEIVEVTLNEDTKFGIEWKLDKTTNVDGKNYQQSGFTKFGLSDEVYGLKYGIVGNTLQALLLSLEKETKVNIRSTPRILTQNNHQAIINISQSVPYLSSTQETTTGGVLTSYEYQDVGVILTVTPRINKSETVTMAVDQEINNLIEFTLFNAPVISKREATASVTVKDGQTMIIGGIIQDNKTETINKVPIISSIPLIGRFFQRKETTPEKTELMVFITPHIIHSPEEADRFSQKPSEKSQ